jgi:hypothetical protein
MEGQERSNVMKRLFLMLVTVLAAVALVSGTGTAADTKGPPCANVINGDAGYFGDTVTVVLTLGAPACDDGSYLLEIYALSGTPLLDSTDLAVVAGDTVTITYTFAAGTAPSDGVCLVAKTFYKKHLADRAPDSGCEALPADSSGASGFN